MKRALWLRRIAIATLPVYAILLMAGSLADLSEQQPVANDKLLHLSAYMVFTLIAFGVARNRGELYRLATLIMLYGLLIEALQGMTPYRTLSLADALANAIGILAALMLIRLFRPLPTA